MNNDLNRMAGDEIQRYLAVAFNSFFKNKMMLILMAVEHPQYAQKTVDINRLTFFLDDVRRHFLPPETAAKVTPLFRHLENILATFPAITPVQTIEAQNLVCLISATFGHEIRTRSIKKNLENEMETNLTGPAND